MTHLLGVILSFALALFAVFDLASLVKEVFWRGRRRRGRGAGDVTESRGIHWRRVSIHLAVFALIIVGFLAIAHFGPLRPVHEWIR
jgi:hypothetical protein